MRRTAMIAAVGALALIAAACTPSVTVESTGAAGGATTTGISVSGVGKVTGEPDTLTMSFGVSVQSETVAEAVSTAAERADAVIAALTAGGVADDDIQTSNYAIFPEYDYRNETQTIVGYRVSNSLTVKVRDLENAGTLIDNVAAAGGDDVTVSGVSFSIEDNEALIEAARAAAWEDANAKAAQLADLAGVDLGTPISIVETFSPVPIPIAYDEALAFTDAAVSTPIAPGTQEVAVTLAVEYEIGG